MVRRVKTLATSSSISRQTAKEEITSAQLSLRMV
jgi:hypothetical protein